MARSYGWEIITSYSNSLHLVVQLAVLSLVGHVSLLGFPACQSVPNQLLGVLIGLSLVSRDHRGVENLSLLLVLTILYSSIRIFHNFVHEVFVKSCGGMLLVLAIVLTLPPAVADATYLFATHDFLVGTTNTYIWRILGTELPILAIILGVLNLILTMEQTLISVNIR